MIRILAHEQAICPHCGTKLSMKIISKYFFRGTDHISKCPNCNREIRPKREPIKIYYCACAGFLSVYMPFRLYLYFVEDIFWKALIPSAIVFAITISIIWFMTIRRIEFI